MSLTWEQKKYIFDHYKEMSSKTMAKNLRVGTDTIAYFRKNTGLLNTREQTIKMRANSQSKKTTSTPEIDNYLRENYLAIPVKQIARNINKSPTFVKIRLRQLELEIPDEVRRARKYLNTYGKGHAPANKGKRMIEYMSPESIEKFRTTQFKKGLKPHNSKEDGMISKRIDNRGIPYLVIRVSAGVWEYLKVYKWAKEHGAPPPKGMCLRHIDGNTLNCELSNLKLITMRENMLMNSIINLPADLRESMAAVRQLRKKITKIKEKYEEHNQ